MISVNISEDEIPQYLAGLNLGSRKDDLHIACVNSPSNVTLSGPSDVIELVKAELDQLGIFAHILKTGIAYHSPAMLAIAQEYASLMGSLDMGVTYAHIPMISSVTGHIAPIKSLGHVQYWVDNLVSPVRFYHAIQKLNEITDVIEVGPHSALRRAVKDSTCSSLRYHSVLQRNKSPLETTIALLGTLFCHEYPVSVLAVNVQEDKKLPFLVDCPPYPFDHSRRYWEESRLSKDFKSRPHSPGYMLGKRNHDWNTLRPQWRNWLCTVKMPWLADHIVRFFS